MHLLYHRLTLISIICLSLASSLSWAHFPSGSYPNLVDRNEGRWYRSARQQFDPSQRTGQMAVILEPTGAQSALPVTEIDA